MSLNGINLSAVDKKSLVTQFTAKSKDGPAAANADPEIKYKEAITMLGVDYENEDPLDNWRVHG